MAVDAGWGTGKTTFLRMWAAHLRNEGFPVVEFNAWETDFAGDPFIALSTELTESLRGSCNGALEEKLERTIEVAKEVARRSLPGAIRLLTMGALDLQPLIEKEAAQVLSSLAENRVSEYQKTREALNKFRESLQDTANALAESNDDRPLVVFIDELDRCRPSYAVELLEAAKHLFAVDKVVFVLALNRTELAHSIRTLYGIGFDAAGYLRRFIDIDFRLPDPDRADFINGSLDAVRIAEFFKRTADKNATDDHEEAVVRDWLNRFFSAPEFGLRRIAKAIHHLGLIFATLRSDQRSFGITAVVALIVRTVDLELYHKFARGEATDLEVVDRVFERNAGLRELQKNHHGCLFETMIILAAHEVSGDDGSPTNSPLLTRYEEQAGDEVCDATTKQHAEEIIQRVQRLAGETTTLRFGTIGRRFGFKHSVQRLDLLSTGLVSE